MSISPNIGLEIYGRLNPASREKAQAFFQQRAAHHRWMEQRFLQTLKAVGERALASKVASSAIRTIDTHDPRYVEDFTDFDDKRLGHLADVGRDALQQGKAMAIDLVAGMSTGFGGNVAKAVVPVVIDARYPEIREVTYLDHKRNHYLELQKKYKRHFIAAEMVSDATKTDVIANLKKFADENGLELILIMPGMPREEIERLWQANKDRHTEALIVPIIEQPSTLYIDSEGKEVGREYMKGHGDFFDVVQAQLAEIMKIMGIEYIFSSNIDNTGALMNEELLGYFVEQATQRRIEAIMEAAEKYEGDKGGAPALIGGTFSVLEGAFVPEDWKEAFIGRDTFPVFNTNTFWWSLNALLRVNGGALPFMVSKKERFPDNPSTWLKVESIMGHGLNQLAWKALVVDRGIRFQPAKFLSDLWATRSDWTHYHRGVITPKMLDGRWVKKPQLEVSKAVFNGVSDVDQKLYGHGSLDSMQELKTLVIGGIGSGNFHRSGDLQTGCQVAYKGDVVVIFEPGPKSGKLVVQGSRPEDTVTLEDTALFVPAGETVTLHASVRGSVDNRVNRAMLRLFLNEATKDTWTTGQRERVVNEFVTRGSLPSGQVDFGQLSATYKNMPDLVTIIEQVREQLDEPHRSEIDNLLKVFRPEGALVYQVEFRELDGKQHPHLLVREGSKIGLAATYPSRADKDWVPARDEKASTVAPSEKDGFMKIYVNPVEPGKGEAFKDKHYVTIPHLKDDGTAEIVMLFGHFDENHRADKKELFSYKLDSLVRMAVEGREFSQAMVDTVEEAFSRIPYQAFFELSLPELFVKFIDPYLQKP
ncbi:MAG: UTP--glucose-1-phosphate uridylyltransferase [Candidatus Margulisbacteria bacterium]|nr:UTP--glucose-1-phosphate uridylyltransferase [Candidatus Margulisiibacteriota bacterium]